ncbi:MAG TPA: site-specific integrase [Steroidobacteraceae bacterium]|jgi:integrase
MAMIRKRTASTGTVTYQAVVRVKGQDALSKTFPTHEQAKRWARDREVEQYEGKHFASDQARKHTVAQAITKYVDDVLPTKRPSKGALNRLDWWSENIGHLTLAEVTPQVLAAARDEIASTPYIRAKPGGHRSSLKEGEQPKEYKRSASTVLSYLNSLGSVMTACVRKWHWLEDSPLRRIEKPSAANERVRFLTLEDRAALLKACKAEGPDLTDLVTLALATGARAGELLGLRWPHIDLKDNRAWIGKTKNGHPRTLMLAGPAAAVLKARAKIRHIDDDRVFIRLDGRAPSDYGVPFGEALTAAGIENFRFHDLRHTAASYLAMSGASTIEIAEVLGHRTLSVVKRYAHLSDTHRAGVVQRGVDKLFELDPAKVPESGTRA